MTALSDEIRSLGKPTGPSCTVGEAVESLPDDDRERLQAILELPSGHPEYCRGADIARWFSAKHGVSMKGGTVNRHRRGVNGDHENGCSCGR